MPAILPRTNAHATPKAVKQLWVIANEPQKLQSKASKKEPCALSRERHVLVEKIEPVFDELINIGIGLISACSDIHEMKSVLCQDRSRQVCMYTCVGLEPIHPSDRLVVAAIHQQKVDHGQALQVWCELRQWLVPATSQKLHLSPIRGKDAVPTVDLFMVTSGKHNAGCLVEHGHNGNSINKKAKGVLGSVSYSITPMYGSPRMVPALSMP